MEEKKRQTKLCSLEDFIFNTASIFLDAREYYFFKVFVLANRTIDIEAPAIKNNVYNQMTLKQFLQEGSVTQERLEKLTEDAKNAENEDLDASLKLLYDKGFIQRNTKYDSDNIGCKTQLIFRATNFVDHFREEYGHMAKDLKASKEDYQRRKTSPYICESGRCRGKAFTEKQISDIRLQLSKQHLHDVKCPVCYTVGSVKSTSGPDRDKVLLKAINYIIELQEQAENLTACFREDEDYLERELRSMRALYNQKPVTQWQQVVENEDRYDRRKNFQTADMSLQEKERRKKERLEAATRGIDIRSVYKKIGPIFKAPRYYQSGLIGNQKPEWLEGVYKHAEQILRKE